jgi:hypothetical protein
VPKVEQIVAPETRWSTAVDEADWIAASLAPFDEHLVASVIPPGFQAYARLLHPAHYTLAKGVRKVRWREISAWSGVPLRPDSQFHSIALPPVRPAGPAPWNSQGPERGSMDGADTAALIELLAVHTSTPSACLFCMWDGWGWDTAMSAALPGEVPIPVPDPVPPEVRFGPRVRLPHRDYLLYTGPIDAALAFAGSPGQTPSLWWPADRAWCVATEVDLCWTYVGGTAQLIEELLADPAVEALPAVPGQPHSWVEPYIIDLAERGSAELAGIGKTGIETSRGSIRATLRKPGRMGRGGSLRIQSDGRNKVSSRSEHRLTATTQDELLRETTYYLIMALTGLVED